MITYVSTSTKLVSENYPYGSLRTTKYDWLEFKKGKGFRHMSQTINPKTGRLNNPKSSTYYKIMLLGRDANGYVRSAVQNMWGTEGINEAAKFMHENFHHFTPEQITELALTFITILKVDMVASVQYAGAKFEDLKPFFEVAVKAATDMATTKENLFDFIHISEEGVKSCEVANYQPFTITRSEPISLMSLRRPQ